MEIVKAEIMTYRGDSDQFFSIDRKGSVIFRDRKRIVEKMVDAGTAVQIFFLFSEYLSENRNKGEAGREGWQMVCILSDGTELRRRAGLGEIQAGSTYLSGFIRQRIMIRGMWLFDGKDTGRSLR